MSGGSLVEAPMEAQPRAARYIRRTTRWRSQTLVQSNAIEATTRRRAAHTQEAAIAEPKKPTHTNDVRTPMTRHTAKRTALCRNLCPDFPPRLASSIRSSGYEEKETAKRSGRSEKINQKGEEEQQGGGCNTREEKRRAVAHRRPSLDDCRHLEKQR